jgi:hypothetical protein
MNLQIVSNAKNKVGGENYTNEYVMPLPTVLDAENKEMYMHVLNISYPLTIENVRQEMCGIRIRLAFPATSDSGIELKYETDMMYIPPGYYTLKKLIDVINSFVDEYDVKFTILNGGWIGVTYNIIWSYWFSDETISRRGRGVPAQEFQKFPQTTDVGNELEIELTPTLQYMLGMRGFRVHPLVTKYKSNYFGITGISIDQATLDSYSWFHFMNKACKQGGKPFACSYMGKYLPNISDGIDKMFIYCDELEMSIVGDTYARLLAIVPLKANDRGTTALCVYTPPHIRCKIIKARVNKLNIGLYDTTHTLIPFSGGTVNIECVIE